MTVPAASAQGYEQDTMCNFIVLSDIHFGSLADHRDFITKAGAKDAVLSNPQPMLDGLIEQAKATGFAFDGILVPGDLTSTAAPSEFVECEEAVIKVADQLGIGRNAIYLTFGNHDVDWAISRLADGRDKAGIDPFYRKIAARVGSTLLSPSAASLSGPLPGSGFWMTNAYEIIILNSGYDCCHDQKIKNGNLGELQLSWLKTLPAKPPGKWRVLMTHHHPMNLPYPVPLTDISTLAEGAELLVEIDRLDVDFVLHGHRHHPFLYTTLAHGWAKPVTFLCAGSVGVGAAQRQSGDIPNLFHIISMTGRAARSAATGTVHTFSFRAGSGWTPAQYSKEVPMDPRQHFGACATQDEVKATLVALLTPIISQGAPTIRLPDFDSFPLELRCLSALQINNLTREIVSAHGYNLVGSFPEAVISTK
jgi:hypothetical protein